MEERMALRFFIMKMEAFIKKDVFTAMIPIELIISIDKRFFGTLKGLRVFYDKHAIINFISHSVSRQEKSE